MECVENLLTKLHSVSLDIVYSRTYIKKLRSWHKLCSLYHQIFFSSYISSERKVSLLLQKFQGMVLNPLAEIPDLNTL